MASVRAWTAERRGRKVVAANAGGYLFAGGVFAALFGLVLVAAVLLVTGAGLLWAAGIWTAPWGPERSSRRTAAAWRNWALETRAAAGVNLRRSSEISARVDALQPPPRLRAEHDELRQLLHVDPSQPKSSERVARLEQRIRALESARAAVARITAEATSTDELRYAGELVRLLDARLASAVAAHRECETAAVRFERRLSGIKADETGRAAIQADLTRIARDSANLNSRLAAAFEQRDFAAARAAAADYERLLEEFDRARETLRTHRVST